MFWRGGHFSGSSVEKCGSGGEWGMGGGGRGEVVCVGGCQGICSFLAYG